jgi:hypothetical protein
MIDGEFIRRALWRHNLLYAFAGIGIGLGTILLWPLSFGVVRFLFAFPYAMYDPDHAWSIGYYVAWGFMALLAFEGFKHSRPLFDLKDYTDSDFYNNVMVKTDTGSALETYYGNPLGIAYLVSQFLYCAPRTTVESIKAFRSIIRTNKQTVEEGQRVFQQLALKDDWIEVAEVEKYGAALCLLDRLELIRVRFENDVGQIRLKKQARLAFKSARKDASRTLP